MAATDPDVSALAPWQRQRTRWLAAAAGVAVLAIGVLWAERVTIADRLIDQKIRQLKLTARYHIDEIGPNREVLSDISLGDADNPDFSVKRLEIDTGWHGGLPAITRLTLVGVRLRGHVSNGNLSFGSLDPLVFAPAATPFRLPAIALTLRDAAASIGGDYGPIGIAAAGDGNLRDGFTGITAMVAPALRVPGCSGQAANFHGGIAIRAEHPRITGPLRMAQYTCPGSALAVLSPELHVDMRLASPFDAGTAHLVLATGATRLSGQGAAQLTGAGDFSLRSGVIAGDFALGGNSAYAAALRAGQLGVAGHLRADLRGGAMRAEGTLSGRDITPDAPFLATLARTQTASAGAMAAPLLAALRGGIARETAADRLAGRWVLQRSASGTSLVLPELHIDGARTARWLALTGAMMKQAPGRAGLAVAGDFAVAGAGFPQVSGHVAPLADGGGAATLRMPAWVAGSTSLAVPIVAVHWNRSGGVGFDGGAVLSGPVPGGQVTGLTIPLQGSWSAGAGLRLGVRCTAVSFTQATVSSLDLVPANPLTLCPAHAHGAMLALQRGAFRIAMRTPGVDLAGRMNGSALKIATGPAALTWPGGLTVQDIAVTQTNAAPGTGLQLAQVSVSLGAVTAGRFSGGDVSLAATPAAVRAAAGAFRWANGRLNVDGGQFRLEDPSPQPNFAPIVAQDVTLTMAGGAISGSAALRATAANRELAGVTLVHDLGSGTGHADVTMPGLVFDKALQPKQLSALAEGVIADAKGTLTGTGRFDWDRNRVTSSGRFATSSFDFAAAFGPVKGVSGTIQFTDLLGLVTAPDQTLAIATINPGIEVDDGILTFAMQPGHVLAVQGAKWPFLDGQLTLLPTRLVLGATEVRRYELRVDGLNAAKFLARMDLSNLAATGTFDGSLPLVFDDSGGRIDKGLLLSRAPGGTVSYVGALTYKDLSPMANYAFQALRALRYRQMRIGMDGALAGDIVTRVRMEGVGQGAGAKRNFITSQIARLPIRFDVNVTAPFMQLVTSFRSLYDPAMVADPRTLGLIDAQGRPLAHPASDTLPAAKKPAPNSGPSIQP